ncbi:MAG: 2,3-bisphosphoglycerate-dependent phosphoglycerate mutase, partial [Candidatus Moranbacteria bacterium]|nr:2,3-bisphosphoglycerate-dependent phosphoglycerate mutase [Candidatus Moranbacteria bacterium]
GKDPRYADLDTADVPKTECLKDTLERFMPFWNDIVVPDLKKGRKIIIAAHGNSLRSLVKHLDNMSEEEIIKLNIPTGVPLVYELNDDLTPIRHYYLGDQEAIKKATEAVANQTKKK